MKMRLLLLVCYASFLFAADSPALRDSTVPDWLHSATTPATLTRVRALQSQLEGTEAGSPEWLDTMEEAATSEPDQRLRYAIKAQLADHYRGRGRLSHNIRHLTESWAVLKTETAGVEKKDADHALAQLVFSLSSVGRVDELQQIFAETHDRIFKSEADYQVYSRAKEAFLVMRSNPGIAYRCGTAALYEVATSLGLDAKQLASLNYEDSPLGGFTLARLVEISKGLGLDMAPVQIGLGPIPVPSVVHWKSDHYAAITHQKNGLYEIVDHTLGLRLYMSDGEIRDESTGHFLVPDKAVEPGSLRLSVAEAEAVIGRGYPNLIDDSKDLGCTNIANSEGCGPCKGMPDWFISEPYLNLWIKDTPLFYKTTDGEIDFTFSFHQRDPRELDWLPATFPSFPKWMNNWLGYVKFTATGPCCTGFSAFHYGYAARVYMPEGGSLYFEDDQRFDAQSGSYFTPIYPRPGATGHLNIDGAATGSDLGFKLSYPDGTIAVFGRSTFIDTYTRYALLTQLIDPKGRTNRMLFGLNTNAFGGTRTVLRHVVDYDDRTNTFIYNTDHTLAEIQSPYGAKTTLGHDGSGKLLSITDAVGLKSTFKYGPDGSLTNMTTPYGTNFFEYYVSPVGNVNSTNNAGGHELINRAVRVLDANGGRHLYVFRYDSTNLVQTSFPTSQIPQNQDDLPLPFGTLDTGGNSYDNLTFRNSFYWNPRTEPGVGVTTLSSLTSANYSKGRWRHWLIENDPVVVTTSSALSFERLGAPSNTSTGAVVWFDYEGKASREKVGTQHRPGLVAARLENGETTFKKVTYNDWNLPASVESTYRPAGGSLVEKTTTGFEYLADIVSDKIYPLSNTNLLLATVTYTNLFIQKISTDGSTVLSLGTYSGYTNLLDRSDGTTGNEKRILSIGKFPQARFATNALNERSADVTYGDKRRVEAVITPTRLVEFEYFAGGADAGKLQRIVTNDASTNEFTYSMNGTPASFTTPLGLTVSTTFDYLYRPLQFDFPVQPGSHEASSITYSYTLASGTNPTGGTNILDVTKITDRQGFDTKFEYTPLRAIKKVTDRENRITDYLYSCSCGSLDAISNSLQVVSFEYDLQSRLTNLIYPDLTRIQYDYDSFGRLKRISESATNFVSYAFNNQGTLSAVSNQFGAFMSLGYNNLGSLTRLTQGAIVSIGVDALGRMVSTAYREGSSWVTNQTWGFSPGILPATTYKNALGEISSFEYNNFEQLITAVQTDLSTNKFGYNAAGQMTGFTNALGGKTLWGYDTEGRLSTKTNDAGTTLISYYYYPNGWVSNRVDALNNSVKYTYDKSGNLKTNTYAGRQELFTYDDLSRLTGMTDSAGTHSFGWVSGNLSTVNGPWASDTLTYAYSHLRRSSLNIEHTLGSRQIQYGYDEAGRLQKLTSPAGVFNYEYPGGAFAAQSGLFGRLNLPGGGLITNVFDHPLGFLTRTALRTPSGAESIANGYVFDLAGQVKTNLHSDTTKTIYGYHPHGALQSAVGLATNNVALADQSLGYKFDADGNLITRTNAALIQTFTTNKLNQITAANATGTITVSGVASPNTTSVTVNGVAATLNTDKTFYKASVPVTDTIFTAIATNAGTGFSATDKVTNYWASSISPTYDLQGNLKTFANRIFGYDEENRLASVIVTNSSSDSKKIEFVYDAFGRKRLRKEFKWQSGSWISGGSGETRYVYDGSLVVEERNSNNQTLVQYTLGRGINGIGGMLARTDAGVHSYYHSDRGGNILTLSDGAGTLKAEYTYDPFGRIMQSSGPMAEANQYQFSSREYDPVTGLYYFHGRFYDPGLQRFLNADPLGEAGGLNLYAYGNNSPPNYIDPTGEDNMYVNATALAANSVQNAPVVGVFSMTPVLFSPLVYPPLNPSDGILKAPSNWSDFQFGPPRPYSVPEFKFTAEFAPADPIPLFAAAVAENIAIMAATEGIGSLVRLANLARVACVAKTGTRALTEAEKALYGRVTHPKGFREQVWERSKAPDGKVYDPTGRIMKYDEPWELGHNTANKFSDAQRRAAQEGWDRETWIRHQNDPDIYRPELPSSNASHRWE